MTPEDLAILLADDATRRVFAAVALGGATSAEILAATGLGAPDAAPAIGRLLRGGLLVAQGPGRLAVAEDGLRSAAEEAERRAAVDQPDPMLRGYVRGGVVTRLPAEDGARLAVLAHVTARTFPDGESYDERAATDRLRPWCEGGSVDVVTLRRVLVDEGFLDRDGGLYKRFG